MCKYHLVLLYTHAWSKIGHKTIHCLAYLLRHQVTSLLWNIINHSDNLIMTLFLPLHILTALPPTQCEGYPPALCPGHMSLIPCGALCLITLPTDNILRLLPIVTALPHHWAVAVLSALIPCLSSQHYLTVLMIILLTLFLPTRPVPSYIGIMTSIHQAVGAGQQRLFLYRVYLGCF